MGFVFPTSNLSLFRLMRPDSVGQFGITEVYESKDIQVHKVPVENFLAVDVQLEPVATIPPHGWLERGGKASGLRGISTELVDLE